MTLINTNNKTLQELSEAIFAKNCITSNGKLSYLIIFHYFLAFYIEIFANCYAGSLVFKISLIRSHFAIFVLDGNLEGFLEIYHGNKNSQSQAVQYIYYIVVDGAVVIL